MESVKATVSRLGGYAAAARVFEVDRSTLLRFCRSGRAIERTRLALRQGVARANASENATEVRLKAPSPTLSVEALMAARNVFDTMIHFIDSYVAAANNTQTPTANTRDTSTNGGNQHGRS